MNMNITNEVEISVIMPCLREENTVGICVEKAINACKKITDSFEIIVVDNGSNDKSAENALKAGAKVIHEPMRGYGSAIYRGMMEARGKYLVIGDSDNTYDFSIIPDFIKCHKDGFDMVVGNRFLGTIQPGAMPHLHRYFGTPLLTGLMKLMFKITVSDINCGMRSLTRKAFEKAYLQTKGMEFASEMIIIGTKAGLRITEIPVSLYSGAQGRIPHLKPLRDGWKHLRLMLLYSPSFLFFIPGFILFVTGIFIQLVLLSGPFSLGSHEYDIHTMLYGALCALAGFQIMTLDIFAKMYGAGEYNELKKNQFVNIFNRLFSLEKGIILGFIFLLIGVIGTAVLLYRWSQTSFTSLNEQRLALFSIVFAIIGLQIIFSSFLIAILKLEKRQP